VQQNALHEMIIAQAPAVYALTANPEPSHWLSRLVRASSKRRSWRIMPTFRPTL